MMDGEDITGLAPHELFHKGLLRTFQIAHEFVDDGAREPDDGAGGQLPAKRCGTRAGSARGSIAEEEARIRAKADEVLEFLTISHHADEKAGNLSRAGRRSCWSWAAR
jgi:branched-chain amino acid transport system ATP-binding protein